MKNLVSTYLEKPPFVLFLIGALFLTSLSYFDWVYPIAAAAAICAGAAIFVFPETAVAFFLLGTPFAKALVASDSGVISIGIFALVGAVAYPRLLLDAPIRRESLPHIFITVPALLLWAIMSLTWSTKPEDGVIRIATWAFMGLLPGYIAFLCFRKNFDKDRFVAILLALITVFVGISLFARFSTALPMLERFAPQGEKVAFARSIGFVLLFCVWAVDKVSSFLKPVVIVLGLISLYLLISAATRAPFAIALAISAAYLFMVSKLRIQTKVFIAILLIIATVVLFAQSYMYLRFFSLLNKAEFSGSIRAMIWRTALANVFNVPFLTGIGLGSFYTLLPQNLKYIMHPHNNILETYLELGIIGCSLYVVSMYPIPILKLKEFIASYKSKMKSDHVLELALLIWLYGMANCLINDGLASGVYEWTALGMLTGLHMRDSYEQK